MEDTSQEYISDNDIDALLGIGVAGAGLGGLTALELERRRRGLGTQGYKQAGEELLGDLQAAGKTIFNSTPHDAAESAVYEREGYLNPDPHRSIRAFSEEPLITDQRYLTTNPGNG